MTPFSGLLFFYLLGLLLLPAVVLGLLEKPLKHYGLLFTVVMLAIVFGINGQLHLLIVFYLWQAGLCLICSRLKSPSRALSALAVLLSLLPLILIRLAVFFPSLGMFGLMGVSYMTFRALQIILEARSGRLRRIPIFTLSYFLLFFPAVSSGPIDRYRRFEDDISAFLNQEEYLRLLRRGVFKLMWGAFFALGLSTLLWNLWLSPLPDKGFLPAVSYMYGYTFYLFFNFSGYSSMAIGASYILGVRLPENFNMPFLSLDIKDFWSRWHMSLSAFLRDYVYTRFVRSCLKNKRFKNPRTASYAGYFINMAIMGGWHGFTLRYLIYGLYHGLLVSANEALERGWKGFRPFRQKWWGQVIMALATFHLVSLGLLIFSGRLI
ncbi:MAG: D-alanyl-lipoteichoic acid biosynthesis protein DltB [Oscillospiraceae bacterium]|jgi:membrane protein involved in D-alanine export|nr:D-alanyl-lipoteichoic acid biosynthesis protein DltB [Oscillospiraceae bacterium]